LAGVGSELNMIQCQNSGEWKEAEFIYLTHSDNQKNMIFFSKNFWVMM